MTNDEREFLHRINLYAEDVLKDIDPQKTHVSTQIEKLRPIMETLSKEMNLPLDEVFIKYMDLQSEAAIEMENKLQEKLGPNVDFPDML